MRLGFAAILMAGAVIAMTGKGFAAPVEYVRICSMYGAQYYYSPGTDTCINANTQQTKRQTEFGTEISQTAFAASVDTRIAEAFQAAAIANALSDPDLVAGEHFGLKINWGGVEGENAFGLTGAVVFSEGLFEGGSGRLTGSGGLAFSGGTVGGRAGLQLSW